MAIVQSLSITAAINDIANLLNTTVAGLGLAASTNYTSASSGTFRDFMFSKAGMFGNMPAGSMTIATGATITGTDNVTITLNTGHRSGRNIEVVVSTIMKNLQPNRDLASLGTGVPGGRVVVTPLS